jgi:hypothetical protein
VERLALAVEMSKWNFVRDCRGMIGDHLVVWMKRLHDRLLS